MNKNGSLTIKDLLNYCLAEYKRGHSNYTVFVTDDEEANGYHALWYLGKAPKAMNAEERAYVEKSNHDISMLDNTDEAIYIG